MGFFNNMKNIKDQALEIDSIKNIDELQVVFDKIDDKAEEETEKKRKEREHFESLSVEEKVEYKRIQKRNQNLKRLGMYGLTVAGMATGVGVPVLMAANVGRILADDDLTFNQDKHDYQVNKLKNKSKGATNNAPKKQKPREYYKVSYDKNGLPKVSTLVDKDPYNLDERFEILMRDV